MQQAQAASEQGDSQAADEEAAKAEKDLEEAQQQLARRRRQAEEDLARQIARLDDSLKSLHERQKKLIGKTQRLENVRATEGRLTLCSSVRSTSFPDSNRRLKSRRLNWPSGWPIPKFCS